MFLFPQTIGLAEKQEEGESAGYSVAKVPPTTPQVDASSAYYDMLVQPGDELVIQSRLTNYANTATTVKMGGYTTYTNDNGEINYSAPLAKKDQDKSLKIPFSEIAEIQGGDQVRLDSKEKKDVSMKITIPQDASEGVILGSWYFEKVVAETEKPDQEKNKAGIQIENRFAYAMAVKLTVKKELDTPNLNLLSVKPNLNSYRKVINARIQNDQAAIIGNLSFKGQITKKGDSSVLFNGELKDRKMAPNSNFNVPFFLGEEQLSPGKYTLHLKATTTDEKWDKKTWVWDEDFTINREQANKYNEEAINDPEPKPNYLMYGLIGIIVLLILILLLVIFRKKKEKK